MSDLISDSADMSVSIQADSAASVAIGFLRIIESWCQDSDVLPLDLPPSVTIEGLTPTSIVTSTFSISMYVSPFLMLAGLIIGQQ